MTHMNVNNIVGISVNNNVDYSQQRGTVFSGSLQPYSIHANVMIEPDSYRQKLEIKEKNWNTQQTTNTFRVRHDAHF
jgi:hypothetical protein